MSDITHECLVCKTNLPFPENYEAYKKISIEDVRNCPKYIHEGILYQNSWVKRNYFLASKKEKSNAKVG